MYSATTGLVTTPGNKIARQFQAVNESHLVHINRIHAPHANITTLSTNSVPLTEIHRVSQDYSTIDRAFSNSKTANSINKKKSVKRKKSLGPSVAQIH
jgi:hypothetical protein